MGGILILHPSWATVTCRVAGASAATSATADAEAAYGHNAAAGLEKWHMFLLWITLLGSAPAWQPQLNVVCLSKRVLGSQG